MDDLEVAVHVRISLVLVVSDKRKTQIGNWWSVEIIKPFFRSPSIVQWRAWKWRMARGKNIRDCKQFDTDQIMSKPASKQKKVEEELVEVSKI